MEYYLDVFIAERYRCNSHILFQTSGVSFVSDDFRPGAYIAAVSETVHVGSIIQVIAMLFECDQGDCVVRAFDWRYESRGFESYQQL